MFWGFKELYDCVRALSKISEDRHGLGSRPTLDIGREVSRLGASKFGMITLALVCYIKRNHAGRRPCFLLCRHRFATP